MKIHLSTIPASVSTWVELIDYMLDEGADTLVNDLSPSMIEYGIDDIEESFEYFQKWINS